jgi:succinoglycan biosynthesis protein ExoA
VSERIGLFDETLMRNQDDELNLRLLRAGGTIWQSLCIKSWYSPRCSLRALFQQYRQYGYWKVRVIQKHKLPASIRHVVPCGFVFALLTLPVLGLWWAPAWWGWLGLVGIYSAGNVLASALTAAHWGWHLLPRLPLVFVCYRVSYGLGFLRGVWDFGIWRRRPAASYERLTRPTAKQSPS